MQNSFTANQSYSNRNRNNSPHPYMPRTANQFGNNMNTAGAGGNAYGNQAYNRYR